MPSRLSHRSLAPIVALLGLQVASSAGAQTTPASPTTAVPRIAQDVFVTATVDAIPIDALARTVAFVTREDLERMGATSLVDALRLVPGIDPRARGPRDVQTDFSIRGSTFGQNLVLVDGVRINNAQSGHHNGEIPATLEGIDRIEVLLGAGSAVHGSDALGGTINVISRRGSYAGLTVTGGQHGYSSASGSVSGHGLPDHWAVTGWGSRSSGFMFDRDFAQGGTSVRGTPGAGLTIDVRHQRRAFGANGFYGASPSKEWTDQTLASVGWQRLSGDVTTTVRGFVRDHHDHFLWDINRPGFAENTHHTDETDFSAVITRDFGRGRRATGGLSTGGDWIASSNLKDHRFIRTSVFGELQWAGAGNTTAQLGLRLDRYSAFGRTLNPSASVAKQLRSDFRVRASVARAFRIPTFTELYYSDPANLGSPDLTPERGWSLDAGADWMRNGWTVSVSPFRRWDENVIDWVKASAPDLWRSTNVRDVTSTGFEASISRFWASAIFRVYYSGLKVDAPALTLLSKYVLEYARHQSGGSVSVPLGGGVRAAVNVDHRHRLDGQSYDLVSVRLSSTTRRATFFLDGSNLLNETYHEVAGVAMPGRWVTAGVTLR